MNCDAAKDLLFDYAAGALEGAERDELAAHMESGCPRCQGRLAEAQAILSMLPFTVPPATPPLTARTRLMERVGAAKSCTDASLGALRHNRDNATHIRHWIVPALVGGALAAGIAILVFGNIIIAERKSLDYTKSEMGFRDRQIVQLRTSVREAQDMRRLIASQSLQVVALTGTKAQPGARARLLWDPSDKSIHFFSSELRNPPPGRAYELWLINSQQKKIPAGLLASDAHGGMQVAGQLLADPGVIVATAVTDEPAAGVQQPTGSFQLLGNVN